ncbi:NAD(P)-binding domain-containing protein [Flavobacterium zhairuonense]|uniref:NAD(P)-binding domain-containing protein n=1 Tax=Flavobacterium zhairuonense TaxID=2493631 RepID=UPI0013C2A181|nr:NAD(P)-binding domain-containing protein [Flavobacterium zhairuonense]KAF2508680.1 NAD(P)-binding domain-containing protein [Flavobacterium zhairuonense]
MKIGIIGIGNITLELALRSARSGHEVLLSNPRGTSSFRDLVRQMHGNIKLASTNQAAAAELIILFLNRDDLEKELQMLPCMKGKIILHTNNHIFNLDTFLPISSGQSSSDMVASLLPYSHIVRLFNPLHGLTISEDSNKDKIKIFFATENQKIKNNVEIYLDSLNFAGINLC